MHRLPVSKIGLAADYELVAMFFDNLAAVEVAIHKRRPRGMLGCATWLFLAISA